MIVISDEQRQKLSAAAKLVRQQAYAPYSNFPVGAAILTNDGEIFTGCNIENASFGLTNCAERGAIFAAVSSGKREFVALALATDGGYSPCGACRQVLAEFAVDLQILAIDTQGEDKFEIVTLGELLPHRFDRSQ